MTTKDNFIGVLVWAVVGLLCWHGGGHPAWSCCPGIIGDRVWHDLNGNGCQDPGEPGIPDVTVKLIAYTPGGPVESYTTTNVFGAYRFPYLCAGDYEVVFETPAGFSRIVANVGCDPGGDERDSDWDGYPIPVNLPEDSSQDLTIDCGFVVECDFQIGDFVWNDLNGNGCQDPGEPGIPDVTVKLIAYTPGGPVESYTTTNGTGHYLFSGLCAGDYEVVFEAPAGFTGTSANVGCVPGGDETDSDWDGNPIPVTLSDTSLEDFTIDCGYVAEDAYRIGDFVWNDLNGNGCQDPGEPGIPDVTVKLIAYTPGGPVESYTTTNGSGYYLFSDLGAGDYEVVFETPAGFAGTSVNVGCDPGGDETDSDWDGDPIPVTLSNHSPEDLTIDCGFVVVCDYRIGDFVWNDLNGNGCQDPGEPGIPDVTVKLIAYTPGGPVESYTTTNGSGNYLFSGLCAGDYEVVFETPAGFTGTSANVGCDPGGDETDSDWDSDPIPVTLTHYFPEDFTIDCGYVVECDLHIDKKCMVMPSPAGYECTDKIVATTLSYTGNPIPGTVTVEIDPDKGATNTFTFSTGLYPGIEISIDARESNEPELGAKTKIRINGVEEVIHTSCSAPYVAGKPAPLDNPKGAPSPNWFVESFVDKDSDAIIVLPVPEFSDSCTCTQGPIASCQLLKDTGQKLTGITFKYTGGGCSASDNDQDPSKAVCSGQIDSGLPVEVSGSNGYSIVPGTVAPGEEFTVSAGSFDSNSIFVLYNPGGTEVDQIHTSCSQPLAVGNVFGSLTVTAINGQRGGTEVIYSYLVVNNGSDLTDVTVVDRVGDTEVFKAEPFDLAKGETREIAWKASLPDSTTNIATVTGNTADHKVCEASDFVTVTVTEPCNICKGGTVELTFQYLGSGPPNVVVYDDNEAKPDKILFQGVVEPDGQFTITPRVGEDKFNNDISLYLDGMFNAKIHTSCSQPLFPGLIFGDFKVVTARSKDNGLICPPDCAATPAANLETKDRTVKWRLTNTGITSLVVERISISWPDENGALKKIKMDGDIFKDALLEPSAVTLPDDAAFVGTFKNRELEPGETRKLEFEFMNDAGTDLSKYDITVEFFGEGCSLHF